MKNIKILFLTFAVILTTVLIIIGCNTPDDSSSSSGGGGGGGVFIPNPLGAGPAPVSLGAAGSFAILSKSGIDTVPNSTITGNIGVSPISYTAITGFALTPIDPIPSTTFSISAQVLGGGRVYASDYAPPTPANMTAAISSMETAYSDAEGRSIPTATELGAGNISGLTIAPGLYKWGTGVLINSNVTLHGGPNDVWIFQIAGGISMASGVQVILTGGALPQNIFWQSFGVVSLATTAHMEGIVLAQTAINLETGASINGRLYAQTAVTLDHATVTQP